MPIQTGSASTGYWDDLCVIPPTAINPNGPDSAMTIITDAAGYIGFLQADAIGESATCSFQIPHRYLEGTNIHPHIHVVRNDATDNTGDVQFEAKFRVLPPKGTATSWTSYVAGSTTLQPDDGADKTGIISWVLSDATYNFGISDIIHMQIRRFGLTTGSVAISSADIHGQIGQGGSRYEGTV